MNKNIFIICIIFTIIINSCNSDSPGELFIESEIIELDSLEVGVEYLLSFNIKNQGLGRLNIFDIIGSCYCIKPIFEDSVQIEPQDSFKLDIMVTRNIPGKFVENFYIHSDDEDFMKKVIIKGNTKTF